MSLKYLLEGFNYVFTLCCVLPAIIGIGIYLTYRLRFVQIVQMKRSFKCLTQSHPDAEGTISRFGAMSTVLAGNFGTGNISGMAVALATGGPGALVWMWIMAFFGLAIQYASCILSVFYRKSMKNAEYAGGPMYYLRDGLGQRWLAGAFCVFTLFGAITVGNFAQINSIILPLQHVGFNPVYCSLIIALLAGVVILGGIQRLAKIASLIVPFKALLYFGAAVVILALHHDRLPEAFSIMYRHAFGFSSVAGGVLGFGVLKAMTTGFDRGLFATDAGTGIVPILQANARSEHPVLDGISTLIAPLVVMIVCTATGLVLIVTGAWQTSLKSTDMVMYAFNTGLNSVWGGYIVMFSLVIFAYTTILAWAYCGEKAWEFLLGSNRQHWFRLIYVFLIPVTCFFQVDMIWILADLAITGMVLINLIGIAGLSNQVIRATKQFKAV